MARALEQSDAISGYSRREKGDFRVFRAGAFHRRDFASRCFITPVHLYTGALRAIMSETACAIMLPLTLPIRRDRLPEKEQI